MNSSADTVETKRPGFKIELFVADSDDSASFYEILEFEIAERKNDGYITLVRDGAVISLDERRLRWRGWLRFVRSPPRGTEIVVYVSDLETIRRRLVAAGYRPGEIKMQPWGVSDFRLRDPSGYYVRVSEGAPTP